MITKVYYSGETGTFTDSSTQGLFLAKFDAPYPEVKKVTVDIVGTNGLIDLSEVLAGKPVYNNRTITMRFIVLATSTFDVEAFINQHHGKIMRFYTDEKYAYYKGRATVTKDDHARKLRSFTITVDAEPFMWNFAETQQAYSVRTGSTSGFTNSASSNMASGYPTAVGKNITLKAASASGGSATYTVSIDSSKLYVLACTLNDYADRYTINAGRETVTGTQLIRPAQGATTATIVFYTKEDTNSAVFGNVCLIALTEVARASTPEASTPYFTAGNACHLYVATSASRVLTVDYELASAVVCYVPDIDPTKQGSGGGTGIYVGLGLAATSGTATLRYRGGALA